ncbi:MULTISPECIES: ABC transporter permease [Olivibacter]|uniref:ABC transporter permease n=1 Tax=Olivibacter oleidegradans TaxID=760123 RepID=A0ABV6HEK8_9SPHI|nr:MULTISPECIES: ABC transporter permease [Olivibacter]MDM8177375.1 ABC transporter permease [Olivibacter sp. 47]QEK99820.1 FtsX-like permease family protein [Olivibacter sp. LS-1]
MFQNYIKIAWRNLFRNKGFSVINIIGLAIGLAAFWFIALYVADELSYDRYHTNADRLVRVVQRTRWNGNDLHQAPTSPPFAPALKAAFPEIEAAARIDLEGGGIIRVNDKKIKQEDIVFADASLLRLFSYHFIYGDPASALLKPQSIVITEELATKLFGSAEQAFNRTLYFDDNFPNQITGVIIDIPQNSHLRFSGVRSFDNNFTGGWQNFHVYTYLLLKDGIDYRTLEKKLASFAAQTIQKRMQVADYIIELQPVPSIHLHSNLAYELSANSSIKKVTLLSVVAILILLIALINYLNLSTAQYITRVKEIGVRKVIGSGKRNIAFLFLTEALLLTFIASGIAIVLIQLAFPYFNELTGKQLFVWRFGVFNTLITLLVFSLFTGIVAGVYPALFLARFKTIPALRGQIGSMAMNATVRKSLVSFQFVITIILISASLVIFKQLRYAEQADLGFNKDQVVTFHIDAQQVRNQISALKAQLLQSPFIEGVSAAGNPIGNNNLGGLGYKFETADGDFSAPSIPAQELMVDADFLPTMDIKLSLGRNFSTAMPSDQYSSALINETLMKKLGWTNPIGKRMKFNIDDRGNTAERTIVGVVKDFHTYSLQHVIEPLVMVMPPVTTMEDNLYVKLAKNHIPEGLQYLEKVYQTFDRSNVTSYYFLDKNFAKQYTAERKQAAMTLLLTALAILIACLGLFGLSIFTTAQRTKEVGIRKVLGASTADIIQMLSGDFLKLVALASLIALPIAWFFMHTWLQSFAYHIKINGWLLVFPCVAVLIITLLTVSFQAIKAALANPVDSLRSE